MKRRFSQLIVFLWALVLFVAQFVQADSEIVRKILTPQFYSRLQEISVALSKERALRELLKESAYTHLLSYSDYLELVKLINDSLDFNWRSIKPLTVEGFTELRAEHFLHSTNPELISFQSTDMSFDPGESLLYHDYYKRCGFESDSTKLERSILKPEQLYCLRAHYLQDLVKRSASCRSGNNQVYEKQADPDFIQTILKVRNRLSWSELFRLDDIDLEAALAVKRLFYLNINHPIFSSSISSAGLPRGNPYSYLKVYGSSVSYSQSLIDIFCTLKKFPDLVGVMYGALVFHGSKSASLLAFTSYSGEDRGSLIPSGILAQRGRVPFAGKLDIGLVGINQQYLSTLFFSQVEYALSYADAAVRQGKLQVSRFPGWQPGALLPELIDYPAREKRMEIEQDRYRDWDKLTSDEQELVKSGFPVLYGLRPNGISQDRCTSVRSDCTREIGLLTGVSSQEIKVIFVPEKWVPSVRRILSPFEIQVEKLERFEDLTSIK